MPHTFQRRKDFLSLTPEDERALRDLHGALGKEAPGFVDGFYRHLLSFPEMQALIPDETALERLKQLHVRYFSNLTVGTYNEDYGEDRRHVGLAHARIGLSPGWYLGGYSHYLTELLPRLDRLPGLRDTGSTTAMQALIKVVFLDMGIAIDSYIAQRDGLIVDLREREQLTRDLLRAQERMEKLAFFDALTGLPNRTHGMDLAQRLLDAAGQQGREAAVLFVDLDRFKRWATACSRRWRTTASVSSVTMACWPAWGVTSSCSCACTAPPKMAATPWPWQRTFAAHWAAP